MQHPPTTPLRALLGLTTIAAASPEMMGPFAGADRRLKSPADTGSGHGQFHPTAMANPMRGANMAADGLGGVSGYKDDLLMTDVTGSTGHLPADKDAALGLDVETAVGTDLLS